jgi:hypothetical protein
MRHPTLDIKSIITPPQTLTHAIEYLCDVLSYDTQGWIRGLPPEQVEWLYESDLSVQVRDALFPKGNNPALIADCDAVDVKSATKKIIFTLWFHLR